jgi:predicted RNase H-like nuclease (RuvC/YqgF family)
MACERSPPSSEKHGAWSAKDELKKWLREAENIIKSRGDTISAGDAQIAGLQSELDDLRKQLAEEKRKVESLGSELQAKVAASGDPEHVNAELARAYTRIEELEARLQAHQEEELKRASKAFDDILTSNQDSCQQYQFFNKVTPCTRTRIRLRERQRARAHRQRQ